VRRPGAPGLYADLLALCERHGIYLQVVAEVERMITNVNLVAAGVGVSIAPASMQGVHAHAVAYRPLTKSVRLNAPLTLVHRAADDAGPTTTFVDLVKATARGYDAMPAR